MAAISAKAIENVKVMAERHNGENGNAKISVNGVSMANGEIFEEAESENG